MPERFRTFSQQIYAGGEPSVKDLDYLRNILGVKSILSLDQGASSRIDPKVKALKMEHVSVPLNPQPSTIEEGARYLQRQIVNILSNRQPIYVHCEHGRDRTGFALAMYRILHDGWTCQRAISEAQHWGYGQGISPQTQNLWKTFLCAMRTDTNSAIDSKDNFLPPAFEPQQSWAPYTDLDHQVYDPENFKVQRSNDRKTFLEEMLTGNQIPSVGGNAGLGPMPGAGPVENSGIMQYNG